MIDKTDKLHNTRGIYFKKNPNQQIFAVSRLDAFFD